MLAYLRVVSVQLTVGVGAVHCVNLQWFTGAPLHFLAQYTLTAPNEGLELATS